MDLKAFRESVRAGTLPSELSLALQALWQDARGDWHAAHELAQREDAGDGAWVHAYLHRKEGDLGNAGYWYARADRAPSRLTLDEEWEEITRALLDGSAAARR